MFSQQPNGGRLEQNPIWVLFIEGFFLMVVSHFQLLTHPQHQSKTKVVIAFSQKINRARSVSRVSFNYFFFNQILAVATWLILYSHILHFLQDNQIFFSFFCFSLLMFLYFTLQESQCISIKKKPFVHSRKGPMPNRKPHRRLLEMRPQLG